MNEREQLEQAIMALEAQRASLGDADVDAMIASAREKLAALTQTAEPAEHRAAPPTITGERRIITILFCDVKGSTAMAEKLDPEEWAAIMNRVFERLIAPVHGRGGTVARLMGDAIMAFFGAPIAHEDDPQRAVLAGLEIIESLRAFQEQARQERGLDFKVRVGINTGLVMVGEVGAEQRAEYTAMGDAVNLAARMEQTARPDTVQITANTYKFVVPLFEFESLGAIEVKGRSDPVLAYRVLGLKAKPEHMRGLEKRGLRSPLVGRDAEFTRVSACVEHLLNGQGGIVGVIGEAGIGKSRLATEIRRAAPAERLYWLEGHTLSFGQAISYWPFQEILRQYAGITEDDTETEAWHKLESKVAALFAENTAEILPYLASLSALEVKGGYVERVKYLDGEAMGRQIYLTSRRFFERLAQVQPLVLVFEDLHWMDESSVNLLEHLLPLVESAPLLIVGLSRPYRNVLAVRLQEIAAKDYADRYTEIRLAPLSQANSTQLVRNLLEIEDLPQRVREMIITKAEGNPFFIEEVIRVLIDMGTVARDPATGRWRATAQVESITIPDTIHGVIIARVDRLEEGVKHVLRIASVIGRSFLYRVLRAIAEAEQRLDDHLAELQQIELIREKQRMPELEYIFKHALAQEATYESILLQKRRELHTRVGQAIELLFADRLEEFYGLLAYHYARAEAWEKAQEYLLKAGDQAGRMAADGEALAHYQQAIAAYARAFGDKWDPVQRAALERKMGEALMRRGEYVQALDYTRRAWTYLGHPLPASRWGVRWAILREIARQTGHRFLPGLFLKNTAGPVSAAMEEQYQLMVATAYISIPLGDLELFFWLALWVLNHSEQNGRQAEIAMGASGVGLILDFAGILGLAGRYHRWAVTLAERLQQPDVVGLVYRLVMQHEILLAEWDAALEHGRRAAEIHRTLGNLRDWGYDTAFIALVLALQGDFTRALAHGQDLVQLGRDGDEFVARIFGVFIRGIVLVRAGQFQDAITHLSQTIELAEANSLYLGLVRGRIELAKCYLRQGKLQLALAELETSRRVGLEHPVREQDNLAAIRNGLAEAYLLVAEQSDASENASERDDWLKTAGRACQAALTQSKAFRGAIPEALRLQGRYEWLRGRPAAARKWWERSLTKAEALRMRYDVSMAHLEIGQRLGERAHLEMAEAIFAEIGAEGDLVRVRELLGRDS